MAQHLRGFGLAAMKAVSNRLPAAELWHDADVKRAHREANRAGIVAMSRPAMR